MSYRQPPPQQYGNPTSSAGAPGSQYGGPDPSSHDGGYGNPDPYAQQQAQDQYGQDQHSAQYHGGEQQQSGTQMQGEAQPNGAADAGGHAADGHKAGANTANGPGANAKKRHPLEHLKEDKNHNDMMGVMHRLSNEPISNAHLFSFIHLVMLFCSYVMKHLGATAPGSEEGGAQGAADGAQIEEEQQQY